jgi:hypothetical protein
MTHRGNQREFYKGEGEEEVRNERGRNVQKWKREKREVTVC